MHHVDLPTEQCEQGAGQKDVSDQVSEGKPCFRLHLGFLYYLPIEVASDFYKAFRFVATLVFNVFRFSRVLRDQRIAFKLGL
jgi:hypothetical protein